MNKYTELIKLFFKRKEKKKKKRKNKVKLSCVHVLEFLDIEGWLIAWTRKDENWLDDISGWNIEAILHLNEHQSNSTLKKWKKKLN